MESVRRRRSALPKRIAEIVEFVRHANEFGSVMRTIWRAGSPDGSHGRERNDSHVCQLMDVAWFVQQRYLPHLDLLKVWKYCMVHDKPETYAGDTPAFADKNGIHNGPDRASKKEREYLATLRLEKEWHRTFPDFIVYLHAYERLEDEESRFVYALDKFLSDLNIYEDNGRTNRPLGITRDEQIAYKRPRIAQHPFLLSMYDEWMEHCQDRRDMFFWAEENQKAAE